MEVHLGRFLTKRERVHHENRCSWYNAIDNLKLYASHQEHMREHWQHEGRRSSAWIAQVRAAAADRSIPMASLDMSPTTIHAICKEHQIVWLNRAQREEPLTDALVYAALRGRTTLQAAAFLRVGPMTLYRRFDHLLQKRASPGCLNVHKAEIVRLVWKERVPRPEIARRYGVSLPTVHGAIQRWSKEDARPVAPAPRRSPLRLSKPLPAHMQPRKA